MPMRTNGLLPVLLVLILLMAVYVGHSEGHVTISATSLLPEMPVDGGVFLLLSAGLIYGGKVLYRKD
jgi:hypothetical protein